jgi:hypothetical protein
MNIYKKLLDVKKKVPYLQKDKKSFQYSYATPSLVLGVFNPLLNEAGIILKTEVLEMTSERVLVKSKDDKAKFKPYKPQVKDNQGNITDVGQKEEKFFVDVYETLYSLKMRFTWVDVETGDKDENLFFASGLNGDEKGVGSALTYAERYFFLKYFNVPTDSDDPDSFQEKHLSDEQKDKIITDKLKACDTVDVLGVEFNKLSQENKVKFGKLVSEFKLELEKVNK